jgi:hypothetical protein
MSISLVQLFEEASAYQQVFEKNISGNPLYAQKLNEGLTVEEKSAVDDLWEESDEVEQELARKHAPLSLGRIMQDKLCSPGTRAFLKANEEREIAALEEKSAGINLQILETLAAIAFRNLGADMLSPLVPEERHSAETSAAFERHNAPTLAKLFAPKNP